MRIMILVIILALSPLASAQVKLIAGLYTLHTPGVCDFETCKEFNTHNELIAVSIDHLVLGRMINSYGLESFLIGAKKTIHRGKFSLDYGIIAATNYPKYALIGGKDIDFNKRTVMFGPLISGAFNINDHLSIEATTQGSALNFGVGIRF